MRHREARSVPVEPSAQAGQVPEELQEATPQPSWMCTTCSPSHALKLQVVPGSLEVAYLDVIIIPSACSQALSHDGLSVSHRPHTPLPLPTPWPPLLSASSSSHVCMSEPISNRSPQKNPKTGHNSWSSLFIVLPSPRSLGWVRR